MDNQEQLRIVTEPGKGYALSGKIMLSAIVILFAVVVFMVGLHLYARWYLFRLRRGQVERRRQRRVGRAQIVMFADRGLPTSVVDRGLELAVLNSLPVFVYSPKAEQPPLECAVCLSEFEEKEIVRLLPKCNHSFHIECIDMWFRSHSTCPLCRSPVERVVTGTEQAVKQIEPVEKANWPVSDPCSSSGAELCAACQHEEEGGDGGTASLEVRRKGVQLLGVRIEVPARRTESENELSQSSPASRLLSFRRILSMGIRSPIGRGGDTPTTPCGGETSGAANELDLESGMNELTRGPRRVQTLT